MLHDLTRTTPNKLYLVFHVLWLDVLPLIRTAGRLSWKTALMTSANARTSMAVHTWRINIPMILTMVITRPLADFLFYLTFWTSDVPAFFVPSPSGRNRCV